MVCKTSEWQILQTPIRSGETRISQSWETMTPSPLLKVGGKIAGISRATPCGELLRLLTGRCKLARDGPFVIA